MISYSKVVTNRKVFKENKDLNCMKDREGFISESRKEVDISLIKKYLTRLDEVSLNLDERKRRRLIQNLENLMYVCDQEDFDSKAARKIRKDSGLSLVQLGEQIGCSKQLLSYYEQGKIPDIRKIKNGHYENTRKYLEFLRDRGEYNPYHI